MTRKHHDIKISDHALVRYIERIKGISLDCIRKEILSDNLKVFIEEMGKNGVFPMDDYKLIVREGTITTILLPEQKVIIVKNQVGTKNKRYGKLKYSKCENNKSFRRL